MAGKRAPQLVLEYNEKLLKAGVRDLVDGQERMKTVANTQVADQRHFLGAVLFLHHRFGGTLLQALGKLGLHP